MAGLSDRAIGSCHNRQRGDIGCRRLVAPPNSIKKYQLSLEAWTRNAASLASRPQASAESRRPVPIGPGAVRSSSATVLAR